MNYRPKLKHLYSYLLKQFIPIFLMTFAICLFLVLMQFLWKYISDLVGKGLELNVIGELFLYAALNLVSLALPLSILLASIMTFGNLGESLELLAIKSAGIPLLRTMKPLIILMSIVTIGAFFFQNNAIPIINPKFYSLLISVRQKSPELDIPEGVFYRGIPGYNMYVEKKNRETGMLYNVMVYDVSSGSLDKMAAIICDSALMKTSEDKLSIVFTMYQGQQFTNFQGFSTMQSGSNLTPYARENFKKKKLLVAFDSNFNRLSNSSISDDSNRNYVSKNLAQLTESIDSMNMTLDSANQADRKVMKEYSYFNFRNGYSPEQKDEISKKTVDASVIKSMDSILQAKDVEQRAVIYQSASQKAEYNSNEYLFRSMNKTSTEGVIRRHWVEWHRKFTIPFACLVFFFIGAPLGSIVRKGGLGMPIVMSVILFIIYYILENVGYKMARDGVWPHWAGMWLSASVLLPLGIFLTYKAMNDSVILNMDTYKVFFRKLFFIRENRNYPVKDVVIEVPNYKDVRVATAEISAEIDHYLQHYSSLNYTTFFMDAEYDKKLLSIKNKMENMLSSLSNARNREILAKAEEYPVLIAHQHPFKPATKRARFWKKIYPVGFLFKLTSSLFEKRITRDLQTIKELNVELEKRMESLT